MDKPAQKQLDRLPPRDFARVDAALVSMATDPFAGDLERLTKHDRYSFRRRVGDYRILFNVDTGARRVRVGAVDRRTTTTYRKRRR